MVSQNKRFSFKIKRQAKNVFPRDVERTVDMSVRTFRGNTVQAACGPVVQCVVSLTSSLAVKMLTILVNIILNSQVFLLKKNVSSFCKCKSYSHFFSKNIKVYGIFNDQSFNDTLTNDIVSFEQKDPVVLLIWFVLTLKAQSTLLRSCRTGQFA